MKTKFLACGLAAALIGGNANAVVIDLFSGGDVDLTVSGNPGVIRPNPPPTKSASVLNVGLSNQDTIGGSRYVQANLTHASVRGDHVTVVRYDIALDGINALDVANTSGADSTILVRWDKNGAGLGGVNIRPGLNSYFYLTFPEPIGNEQITVAITVTDTQNRTLAYRTPFLKKEITSLSIPFTDFSGAGSFTTVNSIVMVLDGDMQWDARISLIETRAPLPGTLVLMGIGLAALTGRGRRA